MHDVFRQTNKFSFEYIFGVNVISLFSEIDQKYGVDALNPTELSSKALEKKARFLFTVGPG